MKHARTGLFWCVLFLALSCFAGSFAWVESSGESRAGEPALRPVVAELSLGELSSCQEIQRPFALENFHFYPVRIVGSTDSCGARGCISVIDLPVTIPPRSRGTITVSVRAANHPGDFTVESSLYTDQPGRNLATIKLKGTVKDDGPHTK